jgi:hypothetical protein
LNSISVFNPVNGRETKEKETGAGEQGRNCAVATLIDVAVQPAMPTRKIENCDRSNVLDGWKCNEVAIVFK